MLRAARAAPATVVAHLERWAIFACGRRSSGSKLASILGGRSPRLRTEPLCFLGSQQGSSHKHVIDSPAPDILVTQLGVVEPRSPSEMTMRRVSCPSSPVSPATAGRLFLQPNKAPEPTTMAVTIRAPSSTARASHGRGSSVTFGTTAGENRDVETCESFAARFGCLV